MRQLKGTVLIFLLFTLSVKAADSTSYLEYHKQINEAERLICEEKFEEALDHYDRVFAAYDFIFLRDYKVAAQLALYVGNRQVALQYLKEGIASGWDLKSIQKNKFLAPLHDTPEWETLKNSYDSLYGSYLAGIHRPARERVHEMFKKDQWKALGALLRIGEKAQQRYATRKFAPHSERQMAELIAILDSRGYPGEKLIGNDFWMSTILSHHNSISTAYSKRDTLYEFVKPGLMQAIKEGQMSPYEYAIIDDWQIAVASERTAPGYGFLNPPSRATLSVTNALRQKIGLRRVETRNKLVALQKRTGMNFYLPDWVEGEIIIEEK